MRFVLFCQILAMAAAAKVAKLRSGNVGASFVRSLQFNQRLRVCNAYPYGTALDVFVANKKVTQAPMPYKSCQEFTPQLQPDDKIDFKVGDASAGTFSIAELPNNDAVLLLAIYRHDTLSSAVSFESHVFANLQNAQVAVIDLYKGAAKSTARIQDETDTKHQRTEELRYDSVVAVNPGLYNVILEDEKGQIKSKGELVAVNRESYVVMRCGVESQQGPAYPQELMIFPNSDRKIFESGAAAVTPIAALLLSALAFTMV